NCVLPGFLEETGMTRGLPDSVVDQARTAHVLGRFNTPAEAGKFIAFLDEMEAVSAQVFQLDSRIRRW
ncbi:MAG: SDR family oxidoreductase, partial [Verrucomicrobiae bacterium]|nr:SDR family oxidoreductase [Verrucomicrobiae bacterium]